MFWTIVVFLLWIFTVVAYVIFNLYNKNKKLENIIVNYSTFINEMSNLLKDYGELSNKIDSQIWVQSDPELLALFEKIKEIEKRSKEFTV